MALINAGSRSGFESRQNKYREDVERCHFLGKMKDYLLVTKFNKGKEMGIWAFVGVI